MTALADAYARAAGRAQAYVKPTFQPRAEKVQDPDFQFDFEAELEKARELDILRSIPKDKGLNDPIVMQARPLRIRPTYPRKTQKAFGQQGPHNDWLADKLYTEAKATRQAHARAPVSKLYPEPLGSLSTALTAWANARRRALKGNAV